ncbi:MAG: hypothetical protein QOD69_2158 [Solirubrobacteraceae bacterium]|nr:hypothetical protein [Solirubrobacteraceae bacterium]
MRRSPCARHENAHAPLRSPESSAIRTPIA